MSDATKIRVTQLRGLSHKSEAQRLCIKGLGLRRIGHTVELVAVEVLRGEAALFGLRHRNGDGSLKAATPAATKAPAKKAAKA